MQEDQKIFKQLLDAVAELINGEGDYGRIADVSPLDDMDGIAVELNDNSESYRQALMEHINESVALWRVNPFTSISYDKDGKLIFSFRPFADIKRDYTRA